MKFKEKEKQAGNQCVMAKEIKKNFKCIYFHMRITCDLISLLLSFSCKSLMEYDALTIKTKKEKMCFDPFSCCEIFITVQVYTGRFCGWIQFYHLECRGIFWKLNSQDIFLILEIRSLRVIFIKFYYESILNVLWILVECGRRLWC